MVKLTASTFGTVMHKYMVYTKRKNNSTVLNIPEVNNFFSIFTFCTYTVCLKICITMTSMSLRYLYIMFICHRCQMSSGSHGTIFNIF